MHPTAHDHRHSYITAGGLVVHRRETPVPLQDALAPIAAALDRRRGAVFACTTELPGRYARSEIGFVDPPLVVTSRARRIAVDALNARGQVLLGKIAACLEQLPQVAGMRRSTSDVVVDLAPMAPDVVEEARTRQPSALSIVRALVKLFHSPDDARLGLYGAFGYDLALQVEPLRLRLPRDPHARDLVLYLPDELTVIDHRRERAVKVQYDFVADWVSTVGLPRDGQEQPLHVSATPRRARDHEPGMYAEVVTHAKDAFCRGDLFEVVPSQTFYEPCSAAPSTVFARLRGRNPAPYGFHINLGDGEHLVGASPEMFVRVTGDRVESCPIAGTVARGSDALDDAAQVAKLIASAKDACELTMCTDVDRNDKSRVCRPGSVHVLARRQIELYARLIHTVDHVEGRLADGYDGLDAFLAHAWAVTVTGAPKRAAMQFIEDHEASPRRFYGGAVGVIGFDGRVDTGIALRTIRIANGVAEVRAGATLLAESDPEEEERETELKASALLDAIRCEDAPAACVVVAPPPAGSGRRILLVDHQDSFVHTLAGYLRLTGATVMTYRPPLAAAQIENLIPDLVVLSPGPGRPSDFDVGNTLSAAIAHAVPVFGVCLGLQGIVEHFGGTLGILPTPMHGKASRVHVLGGSMFAGLPRTFAAGRYHSLYAKRDTLPSALRITAESDDGVIMAIQHATLPLSAVQFHPESILSLGDDVGMRLIRNVVAQACPPRHVDMAI